MAEEWGDLTGARENCYKFMKRLRMQDYQPMITNWKKIDTSGDKEVDPTLYS